MSIGDDAGNGAIDNGASASGVSGNGGAGTQEAGAGGRGQAAPLVSEFKSKSGLRRIFAASLYSFQGFRTAWKSEHAVRQEVLVMVPAAILAILLPVTPLEKLLLVFSLALVLVVELINSAIEAVVDRISLERHPLSKNAKDIGSAAVCLTLVMALATWLVILVPVLRR